MTINGKLVGNNHIRYLLAKNHVQTKKGNYRIQKVLRRDFLHFGRSVPPFQSGSARSVHFEPEKRFSTSFPGFSNPFRDPGSFGRKDWNLLETDWKTLIGTGEFLEKGLQKLPEEFTADILSIF